MFNEMEEGRDGMPTVTLHIFEKLTNNAMIELSHKSLQLKSNDINKRAAINSPPTTTPNKSVASMGNLSGKNQTIVTACG